MATVESSEPSVSEPKVNAQEMSRSEMSFGKVDMVFVFISMATFISDLITGEK
jgi:hypothetical protein